MIDAFPAAVSFVLGREGGLVDDPDDPGGVTNWGISLRFALSVGDLDADGRPDLDMDGDGDVDGDDIRRLDRASAEAIYREHFWDKMRCTEMPWRVGVAVLDTGVNMGRGPAIEMLQRAVGATPDGRPGPLTIAALYARPADRVLIDYLDARVRRYFEIGKKKYLLGWTRRTLACLHHSLTAIPAVGTGAEEIDR